MLERKAVAEALLQLQEMERQSMLKIRQTEAASLAKLQSEATARIAQVKAAEQRLVSNVTAHLHKVKNDGAYLNDMRNQIYIQQHETAVVQQHRFEEVAQLATSLAEQQLRISAERRKVTDHQFQLNLSLSDLNNCAQNMSAQRKVASTSGDNGTGNSNYGGYPANSRISSPEEKRSYNNNLPPQYYGNSGPARGLVLDIPLSEGKNYMQPEGRSANVNAFMSGSGSPGKMSELSPNGASTAQSERLMMPQWHSPVQSLNARKAPQQQYSYTAQAQAAVYHPAPTAVTRVPVSLKPTAAQQRRMPPAPPQQQYQQQQEQQYGYHQPTYPNAVKSQNDQQSRRAFH